ncbi:molybdenum cofactor biosysynthesis protein [Nitrospira sp. KM1]|uniref:MOSC domain-containing protein n=1 Tax=Nitrospira sp. KM1 TaxID=1936990 RepID=UPI0013A75FC1|nr:MOSC N-terminal beta barrel domain-containing protein [Nitrospira sp. KM1]BCA56466.1 molybdenum cofactor biosysynthesis protein [Nitrospira sp. KM1]
MAIETGTVITLYRYPVKSMRGEELAAAELTAYGVLGDRAYALIDSADGKAATAKNPGKWPLMFAFRAEFSQPPKNGTALPAVRITLPDGSTVSTAASDCDQVLSRVLKRTVTVAKADRGRVSGVQTALPAWSGKSEEYKLDMEGIDQRNSVQEFTLPTGTFFDGAIVHLVTTATLNRLHELYSTGRFEAPRFRPNVVVDAGKGERGFVEQGWIGWTVTIGDVKLKVTGPCARCVMTTLPQGDLPKDTGILKTAVQHSQGYVGVYAAVISEGTIRRGDAVTIGG